MWTIWLMITKKPCEKIKHALRQLNVTRVRNGTVSFIPEINYTEITLDKTFKTALEITSIYNKLHANMEVFTMKITVWWWMLMGNMAPNCDTNCDRNFNITSQGTRLLLTFTDIMQGLSYCLHWLSATIT